jgi:hypothetical protein
MADPCWGGVEKQGCIKKIQAIPASEIMEIKVNMECALKILERHGFKVEGKSEEGATLNAKKELEGDDRIELFQVYCGSPYVKFEATLDQKTQRNILETLNKGLENLIQSTKTPAEKSTTSNT